MSFALNFYRDQVATDGATAAPLPAAHRLLYVRHGCVVINDTPMKADDAAYVDGAVAFKGAGEWSELWRWELVQPNAPPALYEGTGVLSMLRMARVISNLAMTSGTRWLLRLDQITAGAGRIADRHQHPGPGIRCLKEGSFNVQQDAESARELAPGDAWWETGTDTVIAWSSRQMGAKFLRGMVVPPELEGRATDTWLSGEKAAPPKGVWKLYVDHVIEV